MGWQWHQRDHMQIICTSLQTDNHASTSPRSFLQAGCPSCRQTNSVKALKDTLVNSKGLPKQSTRLFQMWYKHTHSILRPIFPGILVLGLVCYNLNSNYSGTMHPLRTDLNFNILFNVISTSLPPMASLSNSIDPNAAQCLIQSASTCFPEASRFIAYAKGPLWQYLMFS